MAWLLSRSLWNTLNKETGLRRHHRASRPARPEAIGGRAGWIDAPKIISKCRWEDSDLITCGICQISRYDTDTGALSLYEFDIYNYKTTPAWLSNKYWANPELWEKYRW